MMRFVIEYVFEGHRRGYNFTTPTRGYDEAVVRAVWRNAMPRGQGWGADQFTGAVALKCFPVPGNRFALSEVVVTDQRDEQGRRGIRRAVVDVLTYQACIDRLHARLADLPAVVRSGLDQQPLLGQWRQVSQRLNGIGRGQRQVVVSYPYTTPENWCVAEALVIRAATQSLGLFRTREVLTPFTTLALDHRDESPLVALPVLYAGMLEDVQVIALESML